MKTKILSLLILILLSLGLKAGRESGGGSFVVIDGKVTMADPYYAGSSVTQIKKITRISYGDFPQEIRTYLNQIEKVFSSLQIKNFDRFYTDFMINEKQRYYLVPKERESNVPCERYIPVLNHPVDEHFQFGCTFGEDTYLFVDKWNRAPIEEQALALLHERLWAWRPAADQGDIAQFVTWTQILIQRYVGQVLKGDRSIMPAEEVRGVDLLFMAAKGLGFSLPSESYQVVSGGGVIFTTSSRPVLIENSFLGFGTSMTTDSPDSVEIKNSTLLLTSLENVRKIQISNSHLSMSSLTAQYNTQGSVIIGSEIERSSLFGDLNSKDCQIIQTSIQQEYNSDRIIKCRYSHLRKSNIRTNEVDFNYTDFNSSELGGDSIMKGKEDSRVQISNSVLSKTVIQEGSILENFHCRPSVGRNPDYKFNIGKNSVFRNVRIIPPSERPIILATDFNLYLEDQTEINNVLFELEKKCLLKESHFYFGSPRKTSRVDLAKSSVKLVASGLHCSKRYVP